MENPINMDDLGVPLFWETFMYFHCSPLSDQSDGSEADVSGRTEPGS